LGEEQEAQELGHDALVGVLLGSDDSVSPRRRAVCFTDETMEPARLHVNNFAQLPGGQMSLDGRGSAFFRRDGHEHKSYDPRVGELDIYPVVAFDLDGTLLRGTTVSLLLAQWLGQAEEISELERAFQAHEISNSVVAMALLRLAVRRCR
jgi:hypothetical protein